MTKNRRPIYIIISVVMHVILLLLLQLDKNSLLTFKPENKELQEDRLVFELIETPDVEDEIPDVESNLVSDKNTIASDLNESDLADNELPFQTGDITNKSSQENITELIQEDQLQPPDRENISDILAECQ
jgi:hypothetical protein